MVFTDREDSIWELDDRTGQWYLHNFYKHQPDLNLDHPEVVAELLRAVGFWLQVGFDGFRVDGEINTDDFSPAGDASTRPDIPLHALAMGKTRFPNRLAQIAEWRAAGAFGVDEPSP